MRMLDHLELSHKYLKICLFFQSISFLLFNWTICIDLSILIYTDLLNYKFTEFFYIISILLLSPSKLIFSFWFYFLLLKLQFGSFHIKCFSNETVYPSIHFEGLCSDLLEHGCK